MDDLSELEYELRQLSKVRQPKTLVKVVRQHTRELKRQRKGEDTKALAGIVQELIRAAGNTAQGLFSNQIAGTATFILLATALYPLWTPQVLAALGAGAKAIGDGWKTGVVPAAVPTTRPVPQGRFCVRVLTVLGNQDICYLTEAARRQASDSLLGQFQIKEEFTKPRRGFQAFRTDNFDFVSAVFPTAEEAQAHISLLRQVDPVRWVDAPLEVFEVG